MNYEFQVQILIVDFVKKQNHNKKTAKPICLLNHWVE